MSEKILTIDPGEATGWSKWLLPDDNPIHRLEFGLIPGGDDGFLDWAEVEIPIFDPDVVVLEDFHLDGRTMFPPLDAVDIRGALKALLRAQGRPPAVRQQNTAKRSVGDALLKQHGLWLSKDEVSWVDARDVNDSQLHALAYAKFMEHEPTLAYYWPDL